MFVFIRIYGLNFKTWQRNFDSGQVDFLISLVMGLCGQMGKSVSLTFMVRALLGPHVRVIVLQQKVRCFFSGYYFFTHL